MPIVPEGTRSACVRPFRIVIAAHGLLAAAFLASAEMICGPQDGVVAVGLEPDDSPEGFAERLREALGPPETPALILTDLQGGTPHNVACLVARDRANTVSVSGVNLGVVIEAVTALESLREDDIGRLVSTGRESMVDSTRRLVRDGL
jgi:mannose/fructose-specific phosphotransferase system component IIA